METLKAIRQLSVSLSKGLQMEALAVAGNCLALLESKAPLNSEQREAVKQFLQTLSFNKVPLGPTEVAPLILRAEALVKDKHEVAEESARAGDDAEERITIDNDSGEFRSVFSAIRNYEDRLEMMQLERSFAKMPKDQAKSFLQAIQDAIQACRRRYVNAKIHDLADRVLQKARDIYKTI